MSGSVKDRVVPYRSAVFYNKADKDEKAFEELKQSYPELYRVYSSAKSSGDFRFSFPNVVRQFDIQIDPRFNNTTDEKRARIISRFIHKYLPLSQRSKDGDPTVRRRATELLKLINADRGISTKSSTNFIYDPEEYVPIKVPLAEGTPARAKLMEFIDSSFQWPAKVALEVAEPFGFALKGAIDAAVPRLSYKYGYIPPPALQPLAKQVIVAPRRVSKFLNEELPSVANLALDRAPEALETVQKEAINSAQSAASRILRRLGWTGGGALVGAGLGVGLARGMTKDGDTGYDVPAALLGAGVGGLTSYYLSDEDSKLVDTIKRNKRLLETVGSAAGLGLLYRGISKNPTARGTVLSALVGAAIPSAIRGVIKATKGAN